MEAVKDILEIRVRNSYGDSFERTMEEPTCADVMHEFVNIAQRLGYPPGKIYFELLNEAENIKSKVRSSYDDVYLKG